MPSPRILDFNPNGETSAFEKTIASFVNQNAANRESDALADIYQQYQNDGKNIESAIVSLHRNPNVSPTARVTAMKTLTDFQKHNLALQKTVVKEQEDKNQEDEDVKNLKLAGANDRQIALYKASPVGGRTKVSGDILETLAREKTPTGLEKEGITDFDAGLTPSERVKRQDQRFSIQTPLVNANSAALSSLESEGQSIDLLNELNESKRVGQGLQNLNFNPKNGDLLIPKLATPEEQLFVKTVNDFTVKAKDSYGARVTNFELDRFLQRLPTLANSEEGRRLILRQMHIINELNKLDKKAIQEVFDEHGVRNIDYSDAENKARTKIAAQKEALRKEFLNIEGVARKEDSAMLEQLKSKAPPGHILMRNPAGALKYFPEKNRANLEEKGYVPL